MVDVKLQGIVVDGFGTFDGQEFALFNLGVGQIQFVDRTGDVFGQLFGSLGKSPVVFHGLHYRRNRFQQLRHGLCHAAGKFGHNLFESGVHLLYGLVHLRTALFQSLFNIGANQPVAGERRTGNEH